MPGLPAHLQHGIDFDCLDAAPEDDSEDLPDAHCDPVQRAAKRRRIEEIAAQYLRGRPPLILSAGLRGPFHKGWKNPWGKKHQREQTAPGPNAGAKQANDDGAATCGKADGESTRTRARKLSLPPSPETSRAVAILPQATEPIDEQRDRAEAPSSHSLAQEDDSTGTEFFSADANPPITVEISESNPDWLRRNPLGGVHLRRPQDANADPSPTRTRTGLRPINKLGEVQLAPPRVPIATAQSSPVRANVLNADWQSGASASMTISSPVKTAIAVSAEAGNASTLKRKRLTSLSSVNHFIGNNVTAARSVTPACSMKPPVNTASPRTRTSEQTAKTFQHAQLRGIGLDLTPNHGPTPTTQTNNREIGEHPPTFTPINTRPRNPGPDVHSSIIHAHHAYPSILEGHRAATNLALLAVEKAKISPGTERRPSREKAHESAERCAQTAPSSNAKGTRATSNKKRCLNNLVTSPAAASSTGLRYRKVGEEKPKQGAQKAKPRPVTFSSSPAVGNGLHPIPGAPPTELSPVEESRSARRDIYEIPSDPSASEEEEQQQSFRSSRNSGYSTQAAMMLAQLEFQEGTMPSVASETPGPWVPAHNDTPQQHAAEPSLAFTPFSAFNAKLDRAHPENTIAKDIPISTQELFSAASPFAFSTVKKKPMRPQGSSLRFAVFPSGDQDGNIDRIKGARSPTPSERLPLKAKNSKVSFRSTTSEKGSQDSSLLEPKLTKQDVDLPQLDFRTSSDDLGPNGDLEFTDRFLRNLKGIT
ncbi:hypothetical protein K458DRAFT_199295 [Lentithecium fluviatile CBS 122367]|uniref:Uncharacterized protein n=1 Tax=Lentithecium fluviatile CBS 122367 TaxID=1168545 RepID=A0A6G1J8T0_9PLEO|nr:hypothetical protein K458DRAFT_199295 [Lentithecium fluviatile CBS 122367]